MACGRWFKWQDHHHTISEICTEGGMLCEKCEEIEDRKDQKERTKKFKAELKRLKKAFNARTS